MARLIEVQEVEGLPPRVRVTVGDTLWFVASGGRVRIDAERDRAASSVVEIQGPFVQSVMGPAGQIIVPAGPPNVVLCHATQPGVAEIEIVTGDPFRGSRITALHITVEP